jgi:hypothetical protein
MSLRAGHSNSILSPRTAVVASGEDPGVIPGGLRVLALSAQGTLDAESGWPVATLPDRRDACRSRPLRFGVPALYVFSVALEFGRSQAPTEPHQRCAAYQPRASPPRGRRPGFQAQNGSRPIGALGIVHFGGCQGRRRPLAFPSRGRHTTVDAVPSAPIGRTAVGRRTPGRRPRRGRALGWYPSAPLVRKGSSNPVPLLHPMEERESSTGLNRYPALAGTGAPELPESESAWRWPELVGPLSAFEEGFR